MSGVGWERGKGEGAPQSYIGTSIFLRIGIGLKMRALCLHLEEESGARREGRGMMYEMATIFDIYWTETDNTTNGRTNERGGGGGEEGERGRMNG